LSEPGTGHLNTGLRIAGQSNLFGRFTPPRWPRSRS
jgi:hypothetical protein